MAIDGGLTGIWTRVPLLRAETVNRGKMGQSLLFLLAKGPKCSVFLLGSIQLLSGWSKSITGIGSSIWLDSSSRWGLILLEWRDLSDGCPESTLGNVCKFSIRLLISSSWSSCLCCWMALCCGWLNVPTGGMWLLLGPLPPLLLWFQFWKSIRNPLPPITAGFSAIDSTGRKARGSLNKSAITTTRKRKPPKKKKSKRSGWLDEGYSTDWPFDWTPFFYSFLDLYKSTHLLWLDSLGKRERGTKKKKSVSVEDLVWLLYHSTVY